jgi:hypothetical protein
MLSDGQSRTEKGILTKISDAEFYKVSGSYSFEGTDGKIYSVDYTSDVNGYKASVKGDELSLNLIGLCKND